MDDENRMEFSTADAEDSPCRATSRSSILRVPKPNQDAASVLKRRVSFASSSTVKPFAADPDKVTIWDTTYEEEMNNDSSKMSEDKSLEIDAMNTSSFFYSDNDAVFTHSKMEANTKKLKWPKGKKEFLMDKENFYIHKNDSVPYISSNQVQIYEDSTCNSDMSITMGSIQIESNQTKSAMEEMAFSHGLYENVGGSNKMCNTQGINHSMELTSNLPSVNILCSKIGSDNKKPLSVLPTESSVEPENMQQMDQSMQLTANLPVTNLISSNIKIAQTEKDLISIGSDDNKLPLGLPVISGEQGQTNIQITDESLQLTANLPTGNLIITNANILQTVTDMTEVGVTDTDISVNIFENYPRLDKPDMSQLEQSMQLTANLSNLIKTNINVTQRKSDVLSVESNDQELSGALPNNCEESKQAINSQQVAENLQLTDLHANANVVQTESNMTRTGITNMDISVSSHGKSQGLEKPDKFQLEQSMQLTTNLSNVITTNINVTQRKSDVLIVETNDQELSAALPNNCEELKQVINSQQIDQNLQLTDPHLNANVVQTESNMTRTGITNMDISVSSHGKSQRLEKPDKFQSEQSMQLTSNLSDLVRSNINVTQRKSGVLSIGSNDQQSSVASPNICEKLKQANNSPRIEQNHQLTNPYANVVQTETNMTKTGLTDMNISVSLPEKSQRLEKPNNSQLEQSMQLTTDLPVGNSLRTTTTITERKRGILRVGSNNKDLSTATPDNCKRSKQSISPHQTNESMQLTANLPISNLFRPNTNVKQNESDKLIVGSNALPDNYNNSEQTVDTQQMIQSMQLTADLPVTNIFSTETNSAHKEADATKLKSDLMEFTFGLSEKLDLSRGPTNTNVFIENMELTSDLPVVPITRKSLSSPSKLFCEISGTVDTTSDLLKPVDSSKKGITNLDEEAAIRSLQLTSLSRDTSVDDVTKLRNNTRIFHGLYECTPSSTNINRKNRQTFKNVQVHPTSFLQAVKNQKLDINESSSNLPAVVKNEVSSTKNETVEELAASLPLHENEDIESILNEVGMDNRNESFQFSEAGLRETDRLQTYSNKEDLSEVTPKDVKQVLTESVISDKQVTQQNTTFPFSQQTFVKINSAENPSSILTNEIPSTNNETVEGLPSTLLVNKNELHPILSEVSINRQIERQNLQCSDAKLGEISIPQIFSNKENLSEITLPHIEQALTERVNLDKLLVQHPQSFPFCQKANTTQSFSNIEIPSESLPELDESVLSIQQNENVEFVNVETEQTFSNRDTSKDILKVVQTQLKYKECLKQVVSFNENSEVVPHLDLTLENPHDNPTLTEFSIENVEIGLEESGHTRFEVHGRVDTINLKRALLEVSKHVKAELEQMMTLMDAERMDIFKKEVEANYAMTYYWDQIAIKLDEREKMIKNIIDEKSYLQKAAPNKHIREKFETLMNTNSLQDKHGEPCGSTTTKTTTTLEEKVTELFESSKKCWRFCGTSKNKQRYYFTAMYETIPFEVHIIPNTPTVCDVKGYQNIKANASTLCKYNATLLESHLSKENLSAALGPNYDLLTLLDYVYMTMEQIFSFHQHILDLRKNHGTLKLQIDADFNVSFEIVNVNSLIWWVFTLKLSRTTIGHYDGLEMRSRNFTKENAKEIEGIAQGVSKGPEFLKDFIGNVIDYVNNYTKTYIIE